MLDLVVNSEDPFSHIVAYLPPHIAPFPPDLIGDLSIAVESP